MRYHRHNAGLTVLRTAMRRLEDSKVSRSAYIPKPLSWRRTQSTVQLYAHCLLYTSEIRVRLALPSAISPITSLRPVPTYHFILSTTSLYPQKARHKGLPARFARFRNCRLARTSSIEGPIITTEMTAV